MRIYNLRKLIVLMIISLAINSKSYGQLVGTYTIGGINPDYSTIYNALNDVSSKGVSGVVVFNIRPGTYPGFSIGGMSKLVYPDSIILQSETHDSTEVIISGTVGLTGANGVTLRWLTIEEKGVSSSVAVQFEESYHCNILNCLINTPNSLGNLYDSRSAFYIKHKSELPFSSIRIENCQLIGKGCGFYVQGYKGLTQIISCKILSTGRYSIATWNVANLSIQKSYLNGEPHLDASGPVFSGNIMIGNDIDVRGFNLIEGNEFISLDEFPSMYVEGNIIRSNHFKQDASLKGKIIESNIFDSEARISEGAQILNNIFYGKINFLNCSNSQMAQNVIHGATRFTFSDNARVYNNIFYNEVTNGICSNNKFFNNNFVGSSPFFSFFNVEALYNNFSQEISVPVQSKIKYNNYYPSGGLLDQHPYHYDPLYISSSNPRAQNPLLIGKGELVSFVTKDIDGVSRPKNPTIGASEICVSSFGEMKNITLVCGDGLWLRRCGADKLPGYHWYPSVGLNDTISATPLAKPLKSTRYYFADSTDVILDSVMIEVKGFRVEGFDSYNLGSCGRSFLLSKNFNPTASYRWSPVDWLSNSTIYNPLATPKMATLYVQEITIPGCGLFVDSSFLDINPAPIADAYYSQNELEVTFQNSSSCADQFLWNFGDGLHSTDKAPVHNYDTSGMYQVSLIASNQFGNDTFNFSVQVRSIGIKDIVMLGNNFTVYPNPSSGLIHIDLNKALVKTTFSVYNFLGQLIHSQLLDSVESFDYNLPEAKGVYLIQFIQADGTLYNRKVIKK